MLILLSAVVMYSRVGRREILRFDFVQFIYAFVLVPVIFIWLKTFIFFLLRNELGYRLSIPQLFFADTFFSTLYLFIAFFVVIHSLTKSFNLKKESDPLTDIYQLSEYFHQSLSHFVIFLGSMIFLTLIAGVNIVFPLPIPLEGVWKYIFIGLGVVSGLISYVGIMNYDADSRNFIRIIKLAIGFFTLILVFSYYWFKPSFNADHGVYWLALTTFVTLTLLSFFTHKTLEKKARIPFQLKNPIKLTIK